MYYPPAWKLKSIVEIEQLHKEKGELLEGYQGTWDGSLPLSWREDFAGWCKHNNNVTYEMIISTTVWRYVPGDSMGEPLFTCLEVRDAYIAYLRWREQKRIDDFLSRP